MKWERIQPWDYIVSHVADEYSKKFNMVERDDIKQNLYEWFVSHPRKLTEWEALGKKSAQNLLYRSLRNQALDYCQIWKAKSLGYEVSDLFFYDAAVVESFLPAILLGATDKAPQLNLGMPGKPPAPAEGGNGMAMMAEIKSAYFKLSEEDKYILYLKYANQLPDADIASTLELPSDDAARMRRNRAIKRLINKLGGFRPFSDEESLADERQEGSEEKNNTEESDSTNDNEY
jgi:DNA-directed RNA polymerase specialized sigma24 family protein